MGCDGGTIPRRDELVKVKKKPEAKDKDSELAFQWRYCAITQEILQPPIVACSLGRLYSKIALIEALINRATLPQTASHIRSLKDVRDLNLTPNPVYVHGEEKAEGSVDTRAAPFICPVIGLEMSGKFRFIALWSCGCVFSERALKEIKTEVCHKCLKHFDEDDVVILNGNSDDIELMKQRMEKRQMAIKKKKEKKIKIKTEISQISETEESTSAVNASKEDANNVEEISIKREEAIAKPTATTSAAQGSSKFVAKRPGALVPQSEPNSKRSKATYSVAKDPKVTDVYKSLFTTHKSEKEQGRAHWVTYNPFYN